MSNYFRMIKSPLPNDSIEYKIDLEYHEKSKAEFEEYLNKDSSLIRKNCPMKEQL